jgi:prepilin-type N-terminal cleavage/methylation domain-containing protein
MDGTAYMIISSRSNGVKKPQNAGFTLAELIIAMALSLVISAAVFSIFIMIGRSSLRVVNYSVMETQTRRAFEQLAIDSRMANSFTATFTGGVITAFTLGIPKEDLSGTTSVTYGYTTIAGEDGKAFYYTYVPDPASPLVTKTLYLIHGIKDITIVRYYSTGSEIPVGTTSSTGIKHLQLSVSVKRGGGGVMDTTQVIRSTSFTLRNM